MVDWQTFRVVGIENSFIGGKTGNAINLDKYVQFRDGYSKSIMVRGLYCRLFTEGMRCGNARTQYIEIDIDSTKSKGRWDIVEKDEWREVSKEVVDQLTMTRAASLNPEISAFISDGISRMNRGEIGQFEHKMVDNSGNKHKFIYRK